MKFCIRLVHISVIYFSCASAFVDLKEDSNNEEVSTIAKEEYSQIFKSMPVLFEYFVVGLQYKPELLEKNKIMAFYDQYQETEGKEIEKRSISDYIYSLISGTNDKGFNELSKLINGDNNNEKDEESSDENKNEENFGENKNKDNSEENENEETSIQSQQIEYFIEMYEKFLEMFDKED